jgi:serine/threonine protein phosphatase PrpC
VREALVYTKADMETPQLVPIAGGQVLVYSRSCPGSEDDNEDSAAVIPLNDDTGVLVVADGAGGMPAGEEASRLVVETVRDSVQVAWLAGGSLRGAVLDGIERAGEAIKAQGNGSATTVAAAIIEKNTVRTLHVGDSLVLAVGQRGVSKLQTLAHSPVGYGVEAGLLDEEEAVTHDERHVVSNLVGASEMTIEIGGPVDLARRDTLLLASDGLADNLYQEEIVESVRKGPLLGSAQGMIEACRGRMKEPIVGEPSHADDLTLLIYRRTD